MWKSGLKRRHTYRILKQGLKGLVYAAYSWSNKDYYVIKTKKANGVFTKW